MSDNRVLVEYAEKIREELHELIDRQIDSFLLRMETGEQLDPPETVLRFLRWRHILRARSLCPSFIRMVQRYLFPHGKKLRYSFFANVRRMGRCVAGWK